MPVSPCLVTTMKKFWLFLYLLLCCRTASAEELVSGRLIMVSTQACPYCREFRETVGKFYHKTAVGQRFPLTEIDKDAPPSDFEDKVWEILFVPTFLVYTQDGKEIARFQGYRGDEPFWNELERAIHTEGPAR
ncbi:MAG TPA: hypothetical protein DCS88_03070 [Alphaproteobacteria bacterium]|nr:hypothetical protein [Alphaproteobacteria bacterium]